MSSLRVMGPIYACMRLTLLGLGTQQHWQFACGSGMCCLCKPQAMQPGCVHPKPGVFATFLQHMHASYAYTIVAICMQGLQV